MDICSIILSAGKGSRMSSNIPKPLHMISGKTMLQWVIDANQSAGIKKSIIVAPQEFDNFDIKNKDLIKLIVLFRTNRIQFVNLSHIFTVGFEGI